MGAPAQIDIRRARADELGEVAGLYWRTWHESQASIEPPEIAASRPPDFFENRVAGWSEPPICAWYSGRLGGFAAWQGAYLGQVFVDLALRGTGIGGSLLAAAEAAIAAAGHRTAKLDCIVGNDSGRRFYERHGWHVVDEIDDPHPVEGQSIALRIWHMEKPLDPT